MVNSWLIVAWGLVGYSSDIHLFDLLLTYKATFSPQAYQVLSLNSWILVLFLISLPPPFQGSPNQPFIGQFVSSVVTQGDVWLFAECKDNHRAINGHQKGTISKVLTCDTCSLCDGSLEEENSEEKKTNLEFKLHHANAMNWGIKFIGLWGVFIWLHDGWADLSAE